MLIEHCVEKFTGLVDQLYIIDPGNAKPTRFESIAFAFRFVHPCDNVIIAEAAVPNTSREKIERMIEALMFHNFVALVGPCKWTSCSLENGELDGVYNREGMMEQHTPEAMRYGTLARIVKQCTPEEGFSMFYCAVKIHTAYIGLIEDEPDNIKVTYPHDLYAFEGILKAKEGAGDGRLHIPQR
jgi:2-C-methyl-D-erythritol 4-phosphate cytidylyltransferase